MSFLQRTTIFAAVISTGIIFGCTTAPNQTGSEQQNTDTVRLQLALASMHENEEIYQDSEVVANQQSSFTTKALGLIGGTINTETEIITRAQNLGASLDLNAEVNAGLLQTLGRTNFTIRTSDIAVTNNSDGSVSKSLAVEFNNKTNGNNKKDTVTNTFGTNGNLSLREHYLTASVNNSSKTGIKVIEFSSAGSAKVVTKSSATFSGGSSWEINEERNVNSNGAGTGSGTLVIRNGSDVKNYSLKTTVDASGKLTTEASNAAGDLTVALKESTETSATATINSKGSISTSQINTDTSFDTAVSSSAF